MTNEEELIKENDDGDLFHYLNGKLHRTNGAAVEFKNGDKSWWVNGRMICRLKKAKECAYFNIQYPEYKYDMFNNIYLENKNAK